MARNYRTTLFNEDVRKLQEIHGSRAAYAKLDAGADGAPDALTDKEISFMALRDSFYMASVTADGELPSLRAAAAKPPSPATATNISSVSSRSIDYSTLRNEVLPSSPIITSQTMT